MKERVENMIGDIAATVWLGTFHSICVKILRSHAELVGLQSNFTILGEDDQKRVVKQILEANAIDSQKYPPQAILDKIGRWKDKGLSVRPRLTPITRKTSQPRSTNFIRPACSNSTASISATSSYMP